MYINDIGKKFGKWIVVELINIKNRSHFLVRCECGAHSKPPAYHVTRGYTLSCKSCAPKKHGHYKSATNRAWSSARNRCNNKNNKNFSDYGGRGIRMCERWSKFENFLADMGEKPKGLTLDRIDNDGNYEPGNCRWVTAQVNNANKRNSKKLEIA